MGNLMCLNYPHGFDGIKMKNMMEAYEKNFVMLCELREMRESPVE